MQATLVMLIALGGLGSQNPESEMVPLPPAVVQAADPAPAPLAAPATAAVADPAPVADRVIAPSAYSPDPLGTRYPCGDTSDRSFGDCMRDTLYSFVHGRSPGLPTAREIEAAYHSGAYGR